MFTIRARFPFLCFYHVHIITQGKEEASEIVCKRMRHVVAVQFRLHMSVFIMSERIKEKEDKGNKKGM